MRSLLFGPTGLGLHGCWHRLVEGVQKWEDINKNILNKMHQNVQRGGGSVALMGAGLWLLILWARSLPFVYCIWPQTK